MATLHTCTVPELKDMLTVSEIAAIPRAVLGLDVVAGSQLSQQQQGEVTAWLEEKLRQATDTVVSAVNECASNPKIKMGALKVPAGCRYTALVLARHAVISAIPGQAQTLDGSTRAAEYSKAQQDLARIASCQLYVNDYAGSEDPDIISGGGGISVIGSPAWNWEI